MNNEITNEVPIESKKEEPKIENEKKEEEKEEKGNDYEHTSTKSSIHFLVENKEDYIKNLEKNSNKDTTSVSTGTESNQSQKETNSVENKRQSFAGKTKQWAGNIWNSIKNFNVKSMFPKTEYQEYRNVNGDIVKIPKKKIPLKKKKPLNDNVNKRISLEQNKVINTYDDTANDLYYIS